MSNAPYRTSGSHKGSPMEYETLTQMHSYLMKAGIPYRNVSVVNRPQDLGYHCIFSHEAKDLLTEEIRSYIQQQGFKIIINSMTNEQ